MSKAESRRWAEYGERQYLSCLDRWIRSLEAGKPDLNAMMGCYRHAYGAEINYKDAGDTSKYRQARDLRKFWTEFVESALKGKTSGQFDKLLQEVMRRRENG
jgi:hypothetical protein